MVGHRRGRRTFDHGDGGVEVEPSGEDRQSSECGLLALGEQPVTPVQRGAQRAVPPWGSGDGVAGQDGQAVVESGGDLVHVQRARAGCRELDRQGDAVESEADLGDRPGRRRRRFERLAGGAGPFDEQRHGVGAASRVAGQRQRRHLVDDLAGEVLGVATGRQDPHRRTRRQDAVDEGCDIVDEVLGVVQQQHRFSIGEVTAQQLGAVTGTTARRHDAERLRNRRRDQAAVGHRGKFDEPHAVWVLADAAGAGLEGEA